MVSSDVQSVVCTLRTCLTTLDCRNSTKELKNGDYTIRVRAFDGQNYSDVKEITVTVENKDDDGSGGGFIPGFGVAAVVGAVGISFTITIKKQRKEF